MAFLADLGVVRGDIQAEDCVDQRGAGLLRDLAAMAAIWEFVRSWAGPGWAQRSRTAWERSCSEMGSLGWKDSRCRWKLEAGGAYMS